MLKALKSSENPNKKKVTQIPLIIKYSLHKPSFIENPKLRVHKLGYMKHKNKSLALAWHINFKTPLKLISKVAAK